MRGFFGALRMTNKDEGKDNDGDSDSASQNDDSQGMTTLT
jgi:hypothetical protein